jgi:hypothetical protein
MGANLSEHRATYYLQKARECIAEARRGTSEEARSALLSLALLWAQLAQHAESSRIENSHLRRAGIDGTIGEEAVERLQRPGPFKH